MYATIDIGNPGMTPEFLKGNPHALVYVGYNVDSRIQYVSCNGYSHVRMRVAMEIVTYATQHL